MICEISYDLIAPGKDYDSVIDTIKSLGSWCHALKSTWLVDTELTLGQVHDKIKSHTDITDAYWIVDVTNSDYWVKGNSEIRKWIKEHLG